MTMTAAALARSIEHTLLRADATEDGIDALCGEAAELGMLAVCVAPVWVPRAVEVLRGSSVRVVTTCGFPLGSDLARAKAAQALAAIDAGAAEIDMVMDIGGLKSGLDERVRDDIAAVAAACHGRGSPLKVILEMGYLSETEKERACRLAAQAGADFVKTSTGFGPGGATVADVALMRRLVPPRMGVKAAGGIRDLATALAMIEAGASRVGTSAGAAILREAGQG